MNPRLPLLGLLIGAMVGTAGCTFPSNGTVYDRSRVGRSMNIDTGTVLAVRDVTISGQQGTIGVMGGGLVGHAAGSAVGQGTGSRIAGAGGAVAGAVMGGAVEELATRRRAQEVTVKLSNGDTVAIIQEPTNEGPITVGETVQVLSGGAGASIRRMY